MLRETLRADYHPLARLFLMLADEGLIPPIHNGEPWVIAFHPWPHQLEVMRHWEDEWTHTTVTGRHCYAGPSFQELSRPWLDDHRKNVADAFSARLVPQKLFVDEAARIVTPKNKPWYQKFDKKRRY